MSEYSNIGWILFAFLLIGCDYILLYYIIISRPNSNNIYVKLNQKHGIFKFSMVRLVYGLSILYYFSSPYKLKHENAKLIIYAYVVVILTLLYSLIFNNERNA